MKRLYRVFPVYPQRGHLTGLDIIWGKRSQFHFWTNYSITMHSFSYSLSHVF
ncbi:MAG: hypothetical protein F6J96_08960 [Symploca sp. SIO1C2]|nr:hypothetical protein [Symploca sp. SIO1C2]